MDAYFWLDRPRPGAANMAIDEAMALWCGERRAACLRVYRWSEPSLSLGYFQAAADRLTEPLLASLPFTRRLSGGGAIVHDREVTYSLAVPQSDFSKSAAEPLYHSMHAAIAAALRSRGYDAQTHAEWSTREHRPDSDLRRSPESFLCFQRRSPIDLVIGGAKVVGSAQRRLSGVLLQHGSILTGRSAATPQLPGLAQLPSNPAVPNPCARDGGARSDEGWAELVFEVCRENLVRSVKPTGPTGSMHTDAIAAIESAAAALVDQKYRHPEWTLRR